MGSADSRQVKLAFPNLVNYLNPADSDSCMIEALKAEHRSHSLFDSAVVLFNYIIQITVRSHKEFGGQDALFLEFTHCDMRSGIAIERDLLREAPLHDRTRKEALGCSNIAVFAQEKIDGLSLSIYRAVEVGPVPFDSNVRLIAPP
jgi:hypothetical protein